MLTEFKFTKDDFENSEIYDRKKTDYIGNYLVDFFENKKPVNHKDCQKSKLKSETTYVKF